MKKRLVKVNDEGIAFSVTCDDCPLLPHLKALSQQPRSCIAGLVTKSQGAVPVGSCEFYEKDSFGGDKELSLNCMYEARAQDRVQTKDDTLNPRKTF